MTTPTLKTARLLLAPPLIHPNMDVQRYLRWLSHRTVVQYSEQRHHEHTTESQREYLAGFNKSPTDDEQLWEIQRSGVAIGSITAYRDGPNKTANVGIMIGEPTVWGSGYGAEAWMGVTQYLFDDGIRKVEGSCMASNGPIIAVLNKAGFTREAVLPNYFLLDGKPEDMIYYGKYKQAKIIPIREDCTKPGQELA